MKYIKNNIKLIIFVIVLLVVILFFVLSYFKAVDYELEYDIDGYHVKESFNKDLKIYGVSLSKDEIRYDYAFEHKYTTKRKLVEGVREEDNCVSVKMFGEDSQTICKKDYYYDSLINKENTVGYEDSQNEFVIINPDYDYFIWNGYGLTNVNNNKEYKFLSNESYTNDLYYQFEDYILIADYDQKHEFNKFYIFNYKKGEVQELNLNNYISYDSYFMGNINHDIFLFDCSNRIQYQINIDKMKMRVSSDSENAVYFDKKKTKINKNKLYYNKILFNNDKIYNYYVSQNNLYYNVYNSDIEVQASNIKTSNLLYSDGYDAYFISDEILYKFDHKEGNIKLAKYFEWNFNYLNKIFVFRR